MTIGEFTSHCWSLERRQRTQEELAMIGRGELQVLDKYSNLCCKDVTFFQKSEIQKKAAHSKFFNADVRPSALSSLLDVESHDENEISLSVLPEDSKILSVPYPIVKKVFRDGAQLLTVSSLHQVLLTQFFTLPICQTRASRSALNVCLPETQVVVTYFNVTNTVFGILVSTFAVISLQLRSVTKNCKSFSTRSTLVLWRPI